MDPFTVMVDFEFGQLEPAWQITERHLGDMRGMFLEEPADEDALVYRVYALPVNPTNSNLQCSTTVLMPGTVGSEFFMTKGHFHEVRDRAEMYLGLQGEGRLVMATEDGRWATEDMRKGTLSYIPGGWAHRTVNVGGQPLIFLAAYVGDAGHDYKTIEREGFPILVRQGNGAPDVVPNPRYRS